MINAFPIHVRTLTGLESILAEELASLGARDIHPKSRLVVCNGDLPILYKANLWCRYAIRVLRPLESFAARDEKTFYEGIRNIDWSQWLSLSAGEGTLAVDAHVRSSFTTHSLYIAQLTKDAVVDQFREKTGNRPSVDLKAPDLRVVVNLFQDRVQVFADSSGESLHKRGYRKHAGDAPLNETLAAGILKLSGWDRQSPLIDPMAGSGTFGIEAGLWLRRIAPGLFRKKFGFQKWADYDSTLFENLVTEARNAVDHNAHVPIVGLEIDATLVEIARENIENAGLSNLVKIERADFFEWAKIPKTPGVLVLNPPYDERLRVANVAELWQRIGERLASAYGGWNASVLCGNPDAAKYLGLRISRENFLYNGSIECQLFQYELPVGGSLPSRIPTENFKWKEKAEVFANRLRKIQKHYSKWARRENITCYRVYDWDVPELPFILDWFGDHLHFAEVPRNYEHSPLEHVNYLQLMVKTAAEALGFSIDKIYFKTRKRPESGSLPQSAQNARGNYVEVAESRHRFLVNLSDYIDVGLFLEQRSLRALIEKESSGKDFLNLFGYTGSLTVYAAAGGATSTTTVDSSRTYLDWAGENLRLNGHSGSRHHFVRSDVLEFLERSKASYDLCVVDPPARFVNRASGETFDVQSIHLKLLRFVLDHMRSGGRVYFLTGYRTFELDIQGLKEGRNVSVKEITQETTPFDFERRPSHRAWRIDVSK